MTSSARTWTYHDSRFTIHDSPEGIGASLPPPGAPSSRMARTWVENGYCSMYYTGQGIAYNRSARHTNSPSRGRRVSLPGGPSLDSYGRSARLSIFICDQRATFASNRAVAELWSSNSPALSGEHASATSWQDGPINWNPYPHDYISLLSRYISAIGTWRPLCPVDPRPHT